MNEIHLLIEGRVQHVGFRRYLLRKAEGLNLAGWVCNNDDGSVETYASGDKKSIIDFVSACHQGPLFAHVINVRILPVTQKEKNYTLPTTTFHVLK